MSEIAILLTSHNRKENTLNCLKSIYSQLNTVNNNYSVFLVIDGSTDGTLEAVNNSFPQIKTIKGDGSLFWAGGMRFCFEFVSNSGLKFDFFLLLNDDTILFNNALDQLYTDHLNLSADNSILIGSTEGKNPRIQKFTYGGRLLLNKYNSNASIVIPNDTHPQLCHLGNANIMLIPSKTISKIGFLSSKFTHGIADFEYTLRAKKNGINSYIASTYLGICHIGNNQVKAWKSSKKSSLKERIDYLYSPKGLAYKEYLGYIRKYFPYYLPQAWLLLWVKTCFPFLWDKLKK